MEYATNGAADALRDVLLYEYGWAEEVERTRAIHPLQSMSSALSGLIDLPDDQLRARLEACRATIAAIRRERGDDLGVLELKEYIPRYS